MEMYREWVKERSRGRLAQLDDDNIQASNENKPFL